MATKKKKKDPEILLDEDDIPVIVLDDIKTDTGLDKWFKYYDLQEKREQEVMPDLIKELKERFKNTDMKDKVIIRRINYNDDDFPNLLKIANDVFSDWGIQLKFFEVKKDDREDGKK